MIPYKKVCRQLCGPAFSNEESYTHIGNVFIIFFYFTVRWPGVQAAIGQGFYSGLWRMHQFWISYFVRLISKNVLAIKDINKSLLHAKFQTNWFTIVNNRSDS